MDGGEVLMAAFRPDAVIVAQTLRLTRLRTLILTVRYSRMVLGSVAEIYARSARFRRVRPFELHHDDEGYNVWARAASRPRAPRRRLQGDRAFAEASLSV